MLSSSEVALPRRESLLAMTMAKPFIVMMSDS
jgi:hypothetical protein